MMNENELEWKVSHTKRNNQIRLIYSIYIHGVAID